MLTATFSCFHGLSENAELRLWQRGVLSWNQFEDSQRDWFSARKTAGVKHQIREARAALDAGLADWFLNRLKPGFRTRVYPHFIEGVRFLDIETTGLGDSAEITTVAVYDGSRVSAFIEGINLHAFPRVLKGAELLVTFNGGRFDLPMLRKRFKIDLGIPHLDLMPVVKAHGYHGGLKACEGKMGLKRQVSGDIDGAEAVRLWHRYREFNDTEALRLLIAYNCQDVISLECILRRLYNRDMARHPLFKIIPPSVEPDVWSTDFFFDN